MLNRSRRIMQKMKPLIFNEENNGVIGGGFLLTAASIGLNLFTPYVLGTAATLLTSGESIVLLGVEFTPFTITALYGASAALSSLVSTIRNIVYCPLAPRVTQKLVSKYCESQLQQTLKFNRSTSEGHKNNLISKCYMAVPNVTTEAFTQIIPTTVEVGIAIGILSKWYGMEIGLSLGGILLGFTGYNLLTESLVTKRRDEQTEQGEQTSTVIEETIGNYETIHYFSNAKNAIQRLDTSLIQYANSESKANSIIYTLSLGQNLIAHAGILTICLIFAKGVIDNRFDSNDFYFLASYLAQFAYYLGPLGTSAHTMLAALAELDAVWNEIDKASVVVEKEKKPNLKLITAPSIEFKNVSFSHDAKAKPVLDNVSFKANPSEIIGIVGVSGSGKSTLKDLIFRFLDPDKGMIEIDGQNISKVNLSSLRDTVSIVPQSTVLFNQSIFKNIAFGADALDHIVLNEEAKAALKEVGLHTFIDTLPQGLDTIVGSRGDKLSGGQKQRIAFARALVKHAKILILDEATSALDSNSEDLIQENLRRIAAGKTLIIIAHKLAGLVNADNIIVLSSGKVVEQGKHKDLINGNGLYAELWRKQNRPIIVPKVSNDEKIEKEKPAEMVKSSSSSQLDDKKVIANNTRHLLIPPTPQVASMPMDIASIEIEDEEEEEEPVPESRCSKCVIL